MDINEYTSGTKKGTIQISFGYQCRFGTFSISTYKIIGIEVMET